MNKEFIKKLIKIKKLEYEAIKEILPDKVKEKVDSFEVEAINLAKEVAIELLKEDTQEQTNSKKVNKIIIE